MKVVMVVLLVVMKQGAPVSLNPCLAPRMRASSNKIFTVRASLSPPHISSAIHL